MKTRTQYDKPDAVLMNTMTAGMILLFLLGVIGLYQHRMIAFAVILVDMWFAYRLNKLRIPAPT
jgi:hypothetical protein